VKHSNPHTELSVHKTFTQGSLRKVQKQQDRGHGLSRTTVTLQQYKKAAITSTLQQRTKGCFQQLKKKGMHQQLPTTEDKCHSNNAPQHKVEGPHSQLERGRTNQQRGRSCTHSRQGEAALYTAANNKRPHLIYLTQQQIEGGCTSYTPHSR